MTDKVNLHVGYIGKTRDGKRVEIIKEYRANVPFRGDNNRWYTSDGNCNYLTDNYDIIGPWEEPDAADTAEYTTGEWYGWNGGECPVHPETVFDVTYFTGLTQRSRRAGDIAWNQPLLIRIVTPYVEPKPKPKLECWANVYRGCGLGSFNFTTKDQADAGAAGLDGRIRCVRMIEAD